MSKKLSKRQEAWLYLVFLIVGVIWLTKGWKAAVIFFLAVGIIANGIKFIRGKEIGA